jgi:hypothetical protein
MVHTLDIYRGSNIIATIPIGMQVVFKHSLMAEHLIDAPGIIVNEKLPVQLNDYIIYKGVQFSINTVPNVKVTDRLEYSFVFEGPLYKTHNKLFMDEGKIEFPYYGDASLHIDLWLENVNEVDPGWTKGNVDTTLEQSTFFSKMDCYDALKDIAKQFKLEYYTENKVVHLVAKVGRDTNIDFEYGRGKGLLDLSRTYVNDKNVVTKVYGFGGQRNIQSKYRGGESNLTFEERFITKNTDLYGIIEGFYINEEIYPHRDGTATALSEYEKDAKLYTLTDTSLNFDLNNSFVSGLDPKILFKTGELAGEEFVITKYDPFTKTITYKAGDGQNNTPLPSATLAAKVGDKYTVVDIDLPQQYVTEGEAQVRAETTEYANDNSIPVVEYSGTVNPIEYRDNGIALQPGDRINVKDAKLGINNSIRTTQINIPILYPDVLNKDVKIDVVFSNYVTYSEQKRQKAEIITTKNEIKKVSLRSEQLAKRGVQELRIAEDRIFDTDGKIKSENINVAVVKALLGIFGTESQNFRLSEVYITDNFNGDPNSVFISNGQLIHREISNAGNQNIWELQSVTQSNLIADQLYWVYCKCSRTNQVGTYTITTEEIMFDSDPNFWYFLTGMIYPIIEGYRDSDFTNGIADINGNRLKIGKIISRDGLTGFDLDNNIIFGKITFRNTHGELKDINSVDEKSQLADANALAAQIIADAAMSQLAVYADNGILDTREKVDTLQKYRIIQGDLATRIAQATTYGVSAGAYNNSFVALENYLIPLLANMAVDSPIDRDTFINNFKNYYNAESALLRAVTDAANSKINNISVGGRNYFRRDTPILQQNKPIEISKTDRGFKVFGVPENDANARMYNVITKNGYWTISFDVSTSLTPWSDSFIDICDSIAYYYQTELAPNKHHVEITVNVTNYSAEVYNFIDFNRLSGQWYDFDNIMVENANVASGGWRAAQEDLQADLDLAISQSAEAMSKVDVITNDGILDTSEKVDLLKEYRGYYTEYPIKIAQAATFAVPTAEYTSAYDQLVNYVDNIWLLSNGQNTPVNRGEFYNVYNFYFYARENLLRNITNAANGKINNVSFGGVNLLNNTAKFTQAAGNWTGVEYRPDSIGPADSFDGVLSSTLYGNIFSGGVYYAPQVILKPNTVYTYSAMLWLSNGAGDYSPIWPMHYWLGNTYNNNHYDVASLVIDKDQTVIAQTWKKYWVTFKTPNVSNSLYFRPYIYGGGNINAANFTEVLLEASSRPGTYKPSLSDVYAQAAAIADSIAQSKANIAQAAAIGAAQADAQSRAENAYNNAVAASNSYAQTAANSASSAAQIAAAADASTKANQAYNDAVATANTIYTALTNSLKGLAYQEFVELSKLGSTVVDNGKIKTTLVDAQGIWANIINAGYITAQQIEALNIAVTNLNAVSGTIGGLTISNNSVYSSNGNFSLTSAGALTAKSGQIGGFNIGTSELSSGNFVLSPSKNAAYFSENINGPVVASVGKNNAVIPNSPYAAPGVFMNELNQSVGENVALVVSAKNGALRNIALDIPNGSIRVAGQIGFTGYKNIGGSQTEKYVNGLYITTGFGTNY